MAYEDKLLTRPEGKLSKRVKDEDLLKTVEEVFDKATLEGLYYLINKRVIDIMYGAVASGKESKLYLALSPHEELIAVKIYLTTSGEFRRGILKYIEGDVRFKGVKKDTKSLIYAWAQKEFKNLKRALSADVRVPRPIAVHRNILVMEFIGSEEGPAPLLKDAEVKDLRWPLKIIMSYIHRLYRRAELVHGDLSEYNIMVRGEEMVLFDFGQAVLTSHPLAEELLRRDISNVLNYFERRGALRKEWNLGDVYNLVVEGSEEELEKYLDLILT
ncbi:MAG: serine protein kinase RIO [Candidatus Nezhaarchaeota archaeon]|nr:serine protein kinase RIO [Candidatus Nezhaarchaeota archaeon]